MNLPETQFLSTLCKRDHEHLNTGKSLRYKKSNHCVECGKQRSRGEEAKAKRRERYKKNPEKYQPVPNKENLKIYKKIYYLNNREKLLTKQSAYYLKNREQILEKARNYRRKNISKIKAYLSSPQGKIVINLKNKRREYLRRSLYTIPYTSKELLTRRCEVFGDRCYYCGKTDSLTNDHFFPLIKGGYDCLLNIVPACSSCNSRKNDKDPFEWLEFTGADQKKVEEAKKLVLDNGAHNMRSLGLWMKYWQDRS